MHEMKEGKLRLASIMGLVSYDRFTWELHRAFYSFRRSPVLAIWLLQIPVLVFLFFKGAGLIYLDMAGIFTIILLLSWFFVSVIHGNQRIIIYTLMLLTVGTMLQCLFIREAMLKHPERYDVHSPAAGLMIQYLLAFTAAVAVSFIYRQWGWKLAGMKACRLLFLAAVSLSLLTLLFAAGVGGARNWIRIGSLSIQTTEISKLLYIFLAAGLLGTVEVPSRKRVLALYLVTGVQAGFLIVQNEYGTLLLLLLVFFSLLYLFVPEITVFIKTAALFAGLLFIVAASGYKLNELAVRDQRLAGIKGIALFLGVYKKIANRFIFWVRPEKDPLGLGYQLIKARESMVLGGWFGTGSLTELPVKTSDLVFPALIQRCGMVFALLVFVIFILMWLEGMRLFVRKADRYHQALACGIVMMFFFQTILIIAGSTGLCPLTGITLPFISSGGSSLLVSFVMTGLLITISGQIGWKGEGCAETEEFFKESPAAAKCMSYLRDRYHSVLDTHLRPLARRFGRSRPEKGKSETDHV